MTRIAKFILVFVSAALITGNAHASFVVGNVDDSAGIERVAVASDGRLYAWNKEGGIVAGWPKDFLSEGRIFTFGPRMADLDLDQKQEIIAVSEARAGGSLRLHVFKGTGAELSNWRFSIPDADILETPIIADINHDSSLEIFFATSANEVRAFRRDFRALSDFNEDLESTPRLISADPDNDGLSNLFASVGGAIYEWDEYGEMSVFYRLPAGEEIIGGLAARDVSLDNRPEIIFATFVGRIMAIDSGGEVVLNIMTPSGAQIVSPVVVDDIDVDKEPELIVVTDREEVLAYKTNGEPLSAWDLKMDYRAPPFTSGVVANDLYRGLFSTIAGFDQSSIYRTRHNSYSRIKLGENVREWDTLANFDFLEMIEVFDLFTWPNPFTPNGDGVNDISHVHYRLSDDALVALDLYDNHERFISRIREKVFERAGEHQAEWNGVDTKGTVTPNDDAPLDTGLYIIKVVAESREGFVTRASVAAIVNGVKAEIDVPKDDNDDDAIYPAVFGKAVISGIATDPNFGEDNLDADFRSYKLYYRPGVWNVSNEEIVSVGNAGSAWRPVEVPLRHQCPGGEFMEPADSAYPHSNISCRPVQHGVLGTFNSSALTNGEYTLLLKVTDSNGNTVGKVNYDTRVVTVSNAVAGDPFDAGNPSDPNNPANPRYLGPAITGVSLTNNTLTRQNPSTTISYKIENETANVHVTVFAMSGESFGVPVATYSFNYQAPNDAGNPQYNFQWNGQTSLGRNVNGGTYGIRIEADAVDGTGAAANDTLRLSVARGFGSSDVLGLEDDPATGQERFSATPSHFNPLFIGADLTSQKTHISYELTKDARVTLAVYENAEGGGLVLRRTISSGKINKRDDGTEFWDGTGDNGLILPVGRDYILRLTAEGIDIGNEETITKDIALRLDATALDASVTSDITQLKGDDGITINDGAALTAITGNPDFLWRADATGYVEMPFSYRISANGYETWSVPRELRESYPLHEQIYSCGEDWLGGDMWTSAVTIGHIVPHYTALNRGNLVASNMIENVNVYLNGNEGYNGIIVYLYDSRGARDSRPWNMRGSAFEEIVIPANNPQGQGSVDISDRRLSGVYVSAVPNGGNFYTIQDVCAHYVPGDPGYTSTINSGALLSHQGAVPGSSCEGGALREFWTCGSVTVAASYHVNEFRNWGPYSSSGTNTIISASPTNPHNNFASYSGQVGNGGTSPTIGYLLSVSNTVNGVSTSRWRSGTNVLTLPGLRAWLDASGNISAQVPMTTYSTISNDPYLSGAPYQKIWGTYHDFNEEYYRRNTRNIPIYNEGYAANVFNGNPGTYLYSFSDVVRLTGWNIDVRYPNISVSKPDGDNALSIGSGHLDVFAIDETHVTPPGIRGAQNSNIEDYFRLRLLPLAVPRTFVEIWGSTAANYELFYYDAREETPAWHAIEPRTRNPVNNGILAHWDVTELNGENYTVALKTTNGASVNEDTFDIGIGTRVDTSSLDDDEIVRVYTPFKRASLIFSKDSIASGPELITINVVKPDEADYRLPSGIVPLGPIFDIKPDDIEINPDHHIQLEITYTPAELSEAFGVADATELTIYNLSGDESLEGLATIVLFDDMDDDDPTNDVWRFTANLEHFSQYFLARKISGYFHIESPRSDAYLKGTVSIRGSVESAPRSADAPEIAGAPAELTSVEIGFYPAGNPGARAVIYSVSSPTPVQTFSTIDVNWDASALNGSYVLSFKATGPQGTSAQFELPVAIDNSPTLSTLIINGQAVPNGGSVTAAGGAILEIKADDSAEDSWQSGVKEIEFSIDGADFEDYAQPFGLWFTGGTHSISYRATDNNGNREADKSATIAIQEKMEASQSSAIDLSLAIAGPSYASGNQTWVGEGALLSISATGAGVADIKYRFDDSEYQIYESPIQIRQTSEGQYIFEYFAINNLGLRSEIKTRPLILDVTPPASSMQIEGLSREEAGKLIVTPETRIKITAKEAGDTPAGLSRIEYRTDSPSTGSGHSGIWNTYSRDLQFAASTQIEYRAVDMLGNTETAHLVNIEIDRAGPVLGIVSLPSVISPNGDGRHDTAEFVMGASDDLYQRNFLTVDLIGDGGGYRIFDSVELSAGENRISWDGKVFGREIPEGVYSCAVTVKDEGGNASDTVTGQLVYDVTPPQIAVTNGTVRSFSPNEDNISDVLQVSYTIGDNLFAEGLAVELDILSLGDFEIAKSRDNVAAEPPEHMISWNGTNAMQNGVFDGNYAFEIFAEDPAGNRSQPVRGDGVASGEVFVDRYPPVTTLSSIGRNFDDGEKIWLGVDGRIALTASDPIPSAGVGMILYSFNSDVANVYNQPFTVPVEASDYSLRYSSRDIVGNEEEEHLENVRLDKTAPQTTVSVGEPKEGDDEGNVIISPVTEVSFDAVDADGVGVKNIYTEIEGAKEASEYTEALIFRGLGDGLHTIQYWAEDFLGNTETRRRYVINLDSTPPRTEIVIGDPKHEDREHDVTYVTPNTRLSFKTYADRDDLARAEYRIDGGEWLPTAEFYLSEEREYTIYFRSFDRLGNEEPANSKKIIVDNTPPDADLDFDQSAENDPAYATPETLITLTGRDRGAGSSIIEYSIDGGDFVRYDGPFSFGKLPAGNHVIRYRVRDLLGNISEEKVYTAKLIDVIIKRETNQFPRILALMLQTHDLRPEDPKPNEALVRSLGESGGYLKVVTGDHNTPATVEEFISEMRSDKYNVIMFATDARAVDFYDTEKIANLLKEIKARIYKGDAFISLAEYSDVKGDVWRDFHAGFAGDDDFPDFFDGQDVRLVAQKYGKGFVMNFGADLGRFGQPDAIMTGLSQTISHVIPVDEQNNLGEVTGFTLAFENKGNDDVSVGVRETLPQGWIESANSGGEVSSDGRKYEVVVTAQSVKYVDYLFRSGATPGTYGVDADFEAKWANGLVTSEQMASPFAVENDFLGLCDKLTGAGGLIAKNSMPDVEQDLEMLRRRIGLGNSIGSDEDINALMGILLDAIDKLEGHNIAAKDEIHLTLGEMAENLGALQALRGLSASFSVSPGDPNDPSSYHGDTTSSVGEGGGGCAVMSAKGGNYFAIVLMIPVIMLIYARFRSRDCFANLFSPSLDGRGLRGG